MSFLLQDLAWDVHGPCRDRLLSFCHSQGSVVIPLQLSDEPHLGFSSKSACWLGVGVGVEATVESRHQHSLCSVKEASPMQALRAMNP